MLLRGRLPRCAAAQPLLCRNVVNLAVPPTWFGGLRPLMTIQTRHRQFEDAACAACTSKFHRSSTVILPRERVDGLQRDATQQQIAAAVEKRYVSAVRDGPAPGGDGAKAWRR